MRVRKEPSNGLCYEWNQLNAGLVFLRRLGTHPMSNMPVDDVRRMFREAYAEVRNQYNIGDCSVVCVDNALAAQPGVSDVIRTNRGSEADFRGIDLEVRLRLDSDTGLARCGVQVKTSWCGVRRYVEKEEDNRGVGVNFRRGNVVVSVDMPDLIGAFWGQVERIEHCRRTDQVVSWFDWYRQYAGTDFPNFSSAY